jgi:hypothetical protein
MRKSALAAALILLSIATRGTSPKKQRLATRRAEAATDSAPVLCLGALAQKGARRETVFGPFVRARRALCFSSISFGSKTDEISAVRNTLSSTHWHCDRRHALARTYRSDSPLLSGPITTLRLKTKKFLSAWQFNALAPKPGLAADFSSMGREQLGVKLYVDTPGLVRSAVGGVSGEEERR